MNIYETKWDLVFNLGIKCNLLSISREAGVRYFSSPFDNIDTVAGLRDVADLICGKFVGYFDDASDWRIDNDFVKGSTEVNTKLMWHKDTPKVYYPHFNERWLSGKGMTPEMLASWKADPALDLDSIFYEVKNVFQTRQNRLISLLENKVKTLFVRADAKEDANKSPM